MKRLRITVEGKTYEVTVELPDETAASAAVASGSAAPAPVSASAVSSAGPGIVTSPLGGNVVGVNVKVGQEVKEGEQLVILEAMKMNTYINAPANGKVAEVLVTVGTPVQEGQALIRIE